MKRFTKPFTLSACALVAAVMVSACGGGDAGAPFASTATIGLAVDGYLKDASVRCDVSGVVVRTDSTGFFRFPDGCASSVSLTGGINTDTLLPFVGTLKAPAGSKMVTPLTTLLAGGMSQARIIAALGLAPGTDLTKDDPALTSAGALVNPDLFKKTLAVQQFAQKLTEASAGLAAIGGDAAKQAIYSEVIVAIVQVLATNATLVSGGTVSDSVAIAVSKAAIERLKSATTLPTAVVQGVSGLNSDSFAQVVAGAIKSQADAILGAANSSAAVTNTTRTQQQSTAITTFIQANKTSLASAPSSATAALSTQLTEAVSGTGTPETPAANNLVANGNFSSGATGWSGNAANVVTEGGSSFNLANVAVAGNAYDVNLSYVLNIPAENVRYKLRFKASSSRARTMVAGIGLNQDPYTNTTQVVNLTTTQQTFELSLTSNFASATSRVIFDMGADTGTVVIDDVELMLDTATVPVPAGGPTVASAAPTALAANVKSIFSDSYTNVTVNSYGPDFGPSSARITDGAIAGNNYKTIDVTSGKTFGAVSFTGAKFDATAYTTFNMDYWIDTPIPVGQVLSIKLSNHDGSGETNAIETTVTIIAGGGWQRLSIPLNSFTQAAVNLSRNNIAEIIVTAARADTGQPVKVHFDNLYFSQPAATPPPPPASNLVANGNFSSGATGWSGNAANVVTEGGSSFNLANVAVAGEPYNVNLSYVLNIPAANVRYKLRFKASSNRARTMVAGIGLNQDPYTNTTQVVNLTTTQQTFELSLTSNFASATSRVIFDMGADTGTVVIDDVELVLDTATVPVPAGGPTVASAAPTALAANVKSIFSDSYTNVTVNSYGPDFGPFSARITDGAIAGNNYKTIDVTSGKTFGAVSFTGAKFDATAYTAFNMDYWIDTPIPAGQVLSIKLSNHDGGGETNAIETTVSNIVGGGWQRLSVPLNNFTQAAVNLSRNNIAEIIVTAARADTGQPVKVHFDNLYFSR